MCMINRIRKLLIVGFFGKINDRIVHKKYLKMWYKFLKKSGCDVNGEIRYISPSAYIDSSDYTKIKIGSGVTISRDVLILTHDFSITNALYSISKLNEFNHEPHFVKNVEIGQNVFVGARAIILPGTLIGENCIVGAGCVVKGTIPPNSIIVGNPYRIIGSTTDFANKHLLEKDFV